MSQQSTNQFRYNGEKYTFNVTFDHDDIAKPISLEQQQILKFTYVNALNQLCMTAELECVDTGGYLDQFLDKMYVKCHVFFAAHKQKNDKAITIEKIDVDKTFYHVFLVENMQIVDRKYSQITYRIKLVSKNKINCTANVSYSNYAAVDEKERSLFNILKTCLVQAGLNVDKTSFDNITAPISLDYITNGNDNVETILKFLLNRLFYLSKKDTSFKAIAYNQNYDTYQLFDIIYAVKRGLSTISLSMFNKSQNESMTSQEPAQLATVAKFPYSTAVTNLYQKDFQDYSYSKNEFVDRSIQTTTLLQYYNARPENSDYANKFQLQYLDGDNGARFLRRGTYWNNGFQIYDQLYKTLIDDNSLVVNCPGDIIRCPGNVVAIGIDRDKQKMINDSRSQLEAMMSMYKGLESNWIIAKTVNIVEPAKSRYRQNLVLFRNYVTKAVASDT